MKGPPGMLKNSFTFFRKGGVGDWVNHLTPSMQKDFKNWWNEKFSGSGLAFEIFSTLAADPCICICQEKSENSSHSFDN